MRHQRLKLVAILMFGFGLTLLHAQETVPASGGQASGSGGSVSYSVGQLFFMNHTGENGSVFEGVQQPYEISVVTALVEAEGIDLIVSAFPNPVTDHLILRVDRYNYENLHFQLIDINGRMVKTGIVTSHETIIDMAGLTRTTYLLRILDKEKGIKTFRIIKY